MPFESTSIEIRTFSGSPEPGSETTYSFLPENRRRALTIRTLWPRANGVTYETKRLRTPGGGIKVIDKIWVLSGKSFHAYALMVPTTRYSRPDIVGERFLIRDLGCCWCRNLHSNFRYDEPDESQRH